MSFNLDIDNLDIVSLEVKLSGSDLLEDVYEDLDDDGKQTLIRWLQEDYLLPTLNPWMKDEDERPHIRMFYENINKIADNRVLLTQEEEELIEKIANRF